MANTNYEQIGVVLRIDEYPGHPARVTVKEAFRSFDEARREADRLNTIAKPSSRYEAQVCKFYADGRDVHVSY